MVAADVPAAFRPYLQLPADIEPSGPPEPDSGAVLVTGATGFLGSALVSEVLARWPGRTVYCIVRPGTGGADERLRRALIEAELWDESWRDRLRAVGGELCEPGAGLAPPDAARLRDEVSLMLHSGAFVNLAFPFEQVRAANVGGTVEMLRMAVTGRPKRICHISTLSTIDINARDGEWLPDPAPLGAFEAMTTGYTKSKWIAERLVEEAARRGVDVRTVRMGALAGHSRTGVSNPNDYAWLVVCACLELGAVPLMRAPTSWLPVDLIAQACLLLAGLPGEGYRPYQILPPGQVTYTDVFSWLRRAGYRLPTMAFPAWRERLRQYADRGSRAVQAIASVIPQGGLPGEAQVNLHSPETAEILAQHGMTPPRLTEPMFQTFLRTGYRRNELPAPTTEGFR
ncbi:thioester reductase domain-containing protein [Dactylosporangium sp. NPDC000555]|uniref:thioester reductase domain-containing protein n=1 Tax=Dactylosporangium sp. NPDC000555 TaxID=3154260 RepID=UPI003321E88E